MPKQILVNNTSLTNDKNFTYLTANTTTSSSTLEVQSITAFAINQPLLIGEVGQETSELVYTHVSTAPTGTTVTLTGTMSKAHTKDDPVYILDWNTVEFSYAATVSGTKSTLTSNIDLQIEHKETQYTDTTQTTGFYFTRLKNTLSSINSDYSDPVPYAGYSSNTVFEIKRRALENIGEEIGGKITHNFLNECLWQARREYHDALGKRPFRRKYNVDIGNVSTGIYRVLSPSDLERPQTAENLYGVRIGLENNLVYYDKKDWDIDYRNVGHTTLAEDYATANTYLSITNARDFAESGSVSIAQDNIEYSARNVSTGSLTVSTAGDSSHTAEDDVWQNVSYGLPTNFTVFIDSSGSSYIYFNRPIETAYVDENIYADYYRTLVPYDSDADELDEPEFDQFVHYLSWCIKKRLNPELKAQNDDDFALWTAKKNIALAKEYLGVEVNFSPDTEHLDF